MLYYILKELLRPALRVFYTLGAVEGRKHLPETGPLVVVANHPNTLMDPLLVGMLWRRQLRFLTSSRFFVGVGGWVLRAAGAIPLYRQEDHRPVAADAAPAGRLTGTQRAARNEDSFRATFGLLQAGGALLIFPEGSSVQTRRLRPFKSGAARIALGAEARHAWRLGVQIVPVGLDYAAPDRFRSRLTRRIGPPIRVAAYRAAYEANPAAAIRALTDAVRRALAAQLPDSRTEADESLLLALQPFVVAGPAALGRTNSLLRALASAPADVCPRLLAYSHARRRLRLAPDEPLLPAPPRAGGWWALLGYPGWSLGLLLHYPAYALAARLARRLTGEVEFVASLTLALLMVLLPLFYAAQTGLVWLLTHAAALTVGYLALLPATGWFALRHRHWWTAWRLRRLARTHKRLVATLRAEHAALEEALAKLA